MKKIIVIIVLLLVILFGVGQFFASSSITQPVVTPTATTSAPSSGF